MIYVNCGSCGGGFNTQYSPVQCPYCGFVAHVNTQPAQQYTPPQNYLSSYEISQLNAAYNQMSYQSQVAIENSRKSFKNWIKDSFSWVWQKLKEVGAVKAGLTALAGLLGISIDW